jgi:hypothetical protein
LRLFVLAELEQRLAVSEGPPPTSDQPTSMSKGSGPH